MKSYNHLFEKVLDNENAKIAIQDAGKHKYKNNKRHRKLRYAAKHSEDFVPKLKQWIIEYEPMPHEKITINDGISAKKREIIVPTVKEVMIHHAVVNVLKPILSKGMYEYSYASIPGKGTHSAVSVLVNGYTTITQIPNIVCKWTLRNSLIAYRRTNFWHDFAN